MSQTETKNCIYLAMNLILRNAGYVCERTELKDNAAALVAVSTKHGFPGPATAANRYQEREKSHVSAIRWPPRRCALSGGCARSRLRAAVWERREGEAGGGRHRVVTAPLSVPPSPPPPRALAVTCTSAAPIPRWIPCRRIPPLLDLLVVCADLLLFALIILVGFCPGDQVVWRGGSSDPDGAAPRDRAWPWLIANEQVRHLSVPDLALWLFFQCVEGRTLWVLLLVPKRSIFLWVFVRNSQWREVQCSSVLNLWTFE